MRYFLDFGSLAWLGVFLRARRLQSCMRVEADVAEVP